MIKAFDGTGCGQCCYGLACLIILHVYRFQPSGKYASGDYMTGDQRKTMIQNYINAWNQLGYMPDDGQFQRGNFLLGLVIWIWVGGFALCCI